MAKMEETRETTGWSEGGKQYLQDGAGEVWERNVPADGPVPRWSRKGLDYARPGSADPTQAEIIAAELETLRRCLAAVDRTLDRLAPSEVLRGRGAEVGAMQLQVSLLQAAARGLGVSNPRAQLTTAHLRKANRQSA